MERRARRQITDGFDDDDDDVARVDVVVVVVVRCDARRRCVARRVVEAWTTRARETTETRAG